MNEGFSQQGFGQSATRVGPKRSMNGAIPIIKVTFAALELPNVAGAGCEGRSLMAKLTARTLFPWILRWEVLKRATSHSLITGRNTQSALIVLNNHDTFQQSLLTCGRTLTLFLFRMGGSIPV